MRTLFLNVLAITITSALMFSCTILDNINKKRHRAKEIYSTFETEKKEVYKKIVTIKANSKIPQKEIDALKQSYANVAKEYNSVFTDINKDIDTSILRKGTCIVDKTSLILLPYESDLQAASSKATIFLKKAESVVRPDTSASASIGGFWPIIITGIKMVAEDRIKACKANVKKLTYDAWDDVK
ncbi:hypothetical protein [Dyadobacter bucti]|uniref:hypothetical protein n=1 Tax=Dyadobacter bucti TaxID=2572203 RepID=UPI0011092CDC|nr:hypothetical protein [Dyadobacter bucti]